MIKSLTEHLMDGRRPGVRRVVGGADLGLRVIGAGYLAVLGGLLLMALLPAAGGWQPTLVLGASMSPAIDRGDVVLMAPVSDIAQLRPGYIIVFDRPGFPGELVTHRIVERNGAGDLLTRGDANAEVDSTPVTDSTVRGHVRLVVPSAGLPVLWLAEGQVVPLALWFAGTVLAGVVVFRGRVFRDDARSRPFGGRS